MVRLNQILAIEKGIKSQRYAELTKLYQAAEKPALWDGFEKEYKKLNEEDVDLPGESKRVQRNHVEVIGAVHQAMSEIIRIAARKDWTNTSAKADVKIGDVILIPQVPATHLLFLEKQLTDLRNIIAEIPGLDPADDWIANQTAEGEHKTPPQRTHRTKKTVRPIVKYDATEKHPAQTDLVTEDVIVGFWSLVKRSGAIPEPERKRLITRIDEVSQAVKQAREEANSAEEVESPDVGDRIFQYVIRGI